MPWTSLPSSLLKIDQIVFQQWLQVLGPIAQRRELNRETAQSIVQVGAELAFLDHLFQVAIRGRDHAHVGGDRVIAADAFELLRLQYAQHLALNERRHIADFVQEQRAARALLELADAALIGAGERAFLVAEQFAFQQRIGNRGAIDREELTRNARAMLIQCTGDQLFAGAALAANQHGHILRRNAADSLVHLLHLRAVADERVAAIGQFVAVDVGLASTRHLDRNAHQPANLDRLPHQVADAGQVERLQQIVERAKRHRLDRRIAARKRRDKDHGQLRIDRADPLEQLEAGRFRQQNI